MDVKNYLSDLKKEFSGYNAGKFAKDLMAGVTVAAVALPLALAFGVGSGATAAAGLLTAIISGFAICRFVKHIGQRTLKEKASEEVS